MLRISGLGKDQIELGFSNAIVDPALYMPGNGCDKETRTHRAVSNCLSDLNSIHYWHADVQKNSVPVSFAERLQR